MAQSLSNKAILATARELAEQHTVDYLVRTIVKYRKIQWQLVKDDYHWVNDRWRPIANPYFHEVTEEEDDIDTLIDIFWLALIIKTR